MTFEEYYERYHFTNKLMAIFITIDIIILIIGIVVDAIVNKATAPNPIFAMIMLCVMIIHGFGSIILDKELEKEYEASKID